MSLDEATMSRVHGLAVVRPSLDRPGTRLVQAVSTDRSIVPATWDGPASQNR